MKVLKFGGSSVATAERIRAVADIVAAARRGGEVAVVVSALGGVTDALLSAAATAAQGGDAWRPRLDELRERHRGVLAELAPDAGDTAAALETDFTDLHDLLHGVSLLREASRRTLDAVASYGERLSSKLVAAAMVGAGLDAEAADARRLIVTGPEFGAARVDAATTTENLRRHFATARPIQVVTGFIAATADGQTTTLGRGGSDYTASLLGAALDAPVELWTDVDGVMSADPRLVPTAAPIPRLGFDELMELSHFGAKVVHPPSVHPVRAAGGKLWIKNTFRPEVPGTLVSEDADVASDRPVRGVASIPKVALLSLEGDGMVGVPGIAQRLFGALARQEVSVILISQASSEHSICFAVSPGDVAKAARSVEEEFDLERQVGLIDPVTIEEDLAVVAAVGAGMRHRSGVAGRLFGVLGERGVNVRAIAQGSSERNISLVVDAGDVPKALNAVHDAFVHPRRRRLEVAVAGVGRVGGAFLRQLGERQGALAAEGVALELVAVAGSRAALRDPKGIDPASAALRLREEGSPYDLGELAASLARGSVFVDLTASSDVAALHARLVASGVSVVTANKLLPAGPSEDWRRLVEATRGDGAGHFSWGRYYWETTVGAGLPVVATLQTLTATGDRLRRIEGVLSGTLAFLVDRLGQGAAFSAAVREAHERGYTEPDPREDLSGADVARKLLVLGRLMGREMEPEDVSVVPLLPDASWQELSIDDFWRRLSELDAVFAGRQAEAERQGRRLAYLARLDDDGARVELVAVGPEHPCAGLAGTDNLVAVWSDRYDPTPLVVRGPGAGPEVTAAGVFGDVLRAAAER